MGGSKKKYPVSDLKFKLIIGNEAESDLLDAVKWYEENLMGLGSNFLASADTTIQSIIQSPEKYPKVFKNIRRALIRKFPFGVHYLIDKEKIIILAVFHFRRNPKHWKYRIK